MNQFDNGRPGDQRGFVHKKILGAVSTITGALPIPGANIVSTITRSLAGSRNVSRTATARPTQYSAAQKELGRGLKMAGGGGGGGGFRRGLNISGSLPCIWPAKRLPSGECVLGERKGRDLPSGFDVGEAVMGQYGAALMPGSMPVDRAVCLRGMQLGNDGLCYNKSQISNSQRMWPKGRRPLLTGGDMRAISIASRAGKRLERTTKRLQTMGMLKKPTSRRLPPGRGRALVVKEAGAGSVTVQ